MIVTKVWRLEWKQRREEARSLAMVIWAPWMCNFIQFVVFFLLLEIVKRAAIQNESFVRYSRFIVRNIWSKMLISDLGDFIIGMEIYERG